MEATLSPFYDSFFDSEVEFSTYERLSREEVPGRPVRWFIPFGRLALCVAAATTITLSLAGQASATEARLSTHVIQTQRPRAAKLTPSQVIRSDIFRRFTADVAEEGDSYGPDPDYGF